MWQGLDIYGLIWIIVRGGFSGRERVEGSLHDRGHGMFGDVAWELG